MQILVIAGKQRRSHPVGISHGGHGVAILSHRDNIRRTGSNAEQHRQLLPDGDVRVIAVAVGRDQGLALLLIPEQRAAACVYLPDGVGGQVIVAPGLPNVTVYEYDGVPEKGDRLIAAQLLQCLLVGAEDGGVIVTEPELLSDILGVYQEEYIVDVGVAEQGLSLFGSEPLYGSGPGRFTVHRDPQSGGCRRRRLGVLLLRRVLYRAVRLLGAGDGSAQEQNPHQRGAEQFGQLLHIIPPCLSFTHSPSKYTQHSHNQDKLH
ncbi:MAG: hypothetical protein DBX95_07915 [Oscillibacter sp.]|nr:MAG: hypothetical protein DBX95_07915 [Oscillibacter sp.]